MKKFKKAMALSLALAMGLSLVACGGSTEDTTEATEAETTEAATEADEDTTEADEDTTEASQTEAAEADDVKANASMKKDELIAFAEEHGIEIDAKATKQVIIDTINENL